MKTLNIFVFIVLVFLTACESEDIYTEPIAKIVATNTELAIHEMVTFSNQGQGQKITIFTGKKGEQYTSSEGAQKGIELTSQNPKLTTSYSESGVYNAVIIATGFNADGTNLTRDVDSIKIIVTDTIKTIDSIRVSMETDYAPKGIYTIFYPPRDVFIYNYEVRPDENKNVVIPVHSLSNPNWMLLSGTSFIKGIEEFNFQPKIKSESRSLSYKIEEIEGEFLNDGSQRVSHVENGEFVPREYKVMNDNDHINSFYVCAITLPYFKSFILKDTQGVSYSPKFKINPSRLSSVFK